MAVGIPLLNSIQCPALWDDVVSEVPEVVAVDLWRYRQART